MLEMHSPVTKVPLCMLGHTGEKGNKQESCESHKKEEKTTAYPKINWAAPYASPSVRSIH